MTIRDLENRLRAAGVVIRMDRYDTLGAWLGDRRLTVAETTEGVYRNIAAQNGITLKEVT